VPRKQLTTEAVTVKNNLVTVADSKRAADLFARILRAVREQTEEDKRKRNRGRESAA
jgi:hypothetical protein